MKRREFVAAGIASMAFPYVGATARETCSPQTPWRPAVCTAEVDLGRVVYAAQDKSQWCWAASVEMIFRYYGLDISQRDIVIAVYGRPENFRSGPPSTMSRLFSRDWEGRDGRHFRCRLRGLFDAYEGINAMNNFTIIRALAQEQPLLYCNQSHAMVQTAISYIPTPMGPNVVNVGFVDPWPGIGIRGPQPGEERAVHLGGQMTYLALPSVQEI